MKISKLFLLIVLLLIDATVCSAVDSTGVNLKLRECYRLNKTRDIDLVNKSKDLIPIAKAFPKSDASVRIYTLVGRGYMNNNNFDSSIKYFKLALSNLSSRVSSDAKGKLSIALGWYYFQVGEENTAFNYDTEAYNYFAANKDSLSMANALANLATLVDALGQYNKGLAYKEQALAIYKKRKDTLGILRSLNNIASNYLNKDNPGKAISLLKEAISINKNYEHTALNSTIYGNIGFALLNLGRFTEAEKVGDTIIFLSEKNKFQSDLGKAYMFKAYSLAEKNEATEALRFADSAMLRLPYDFNIQTKGLVYKGLIQIYSKFKMFDKALNASLIRDSILIAGNDSSSAAAFANKEFKFQLSNSKSEIESLRQLSESQSKQVQSQKQIIGLIIGIVVIFLSAFLLTLYLFRKSKKAEKAIQSQNLVVEKQNQELKRQNELQLMTIGIVGHDLRGPLASALTLKEIMIAMLQSGQIDESIHLAKLHFDSLERIHGLANNLVHWVLSAQSGINLNFSNLYVKDLINEVLLNFETVLKEKNIEVVLNFHPSCNVYADQASVQTILRNIIQNAIKFTPEHKKITITAFGHARTPGRMHIFINDEGKGIAPDVLEKINAGKKVVTNGTNGEKGNGLGLIVIQTLLSLNNGRMIIQSEIGKGTSFQIDLPSSESNEWDW